MLQLSFRWFSWSFELKRGAEVVASADMALLRQRGRVRAEGRAFEIRRQGMAGAFELLDGDTVLASAVKASIFQRKFLIDFGATRYELESESILSRSFELRRDGRVVGSIRARFLRRDANVEFPDELPPAAMAFLVWLVVLLWKRADSSD